MNEIKSGIKFNLSDKNPVGSNVASFSALASELELSIPDYQRPYVWEIKQTRMLLKDIENSENGALLGSIILHETKRDDEIIYEVIDGQQRLTTIKLILMVLSEYKIVMENHNGYSNYLSNVSFFHKISQDNIKANYEYIKNYLSNEDKAKDFLENLEKTQFIIVATTKADDAFIFFDNTNSKGKKLENYDLIKAFHLQAMQERHKDLQNANAKYFESVIKADKDNIDSFLNQTLNFTRKIIKQEYERTKWWSDDLIFDEFCKENLSGQSSCDYGVISDFANGVEFFEYFRKFYEILKIIRQTDFYQKLNHLDGTGYLQNALCMCIVVFMDRFKSGNFDKMIRFATRIIYTNRLVGKSVRWESTMGSSEKIIRAIFVNNYESKIYEGLDEIARECYAYEQEKIAENPIDGGKRGDYKELCKDYLDEEFKKYGILGHFLGEQNGAK
ncbi:DUF262 domain-containing protein [Campylobacter sp. RM12651]|uniref:DUF262 domain-containing protein n=1 Tax=Campylobacter sp. RM12651 TaxID=1660079 RepID=UPI001EFA54F4|nr:DUF262 domain-containing protein [Campylobacter sp. RM12651]ULO03936.1 DUF262 domain-containing protein [Campylobacter sp. RM12651]